MNQQSESELALENLEIEHAQFMSDLEALRTQDMLQQREDDAFEEEAQDLALDMQASYIDMMSLAC
jgi:hypothetical protein